MDIKVHLTVFKINNLYFACINAKTFEKRMIFLNFIVGLY